MTFYLKPGSVPGNPRTKRPTNLRKITPEAEPMDQHWLDAQFPENSKALAERVSAIQSGPVMRPKSKSYADYRAELERCWPFVAELYVGTMMDETIVPFSTLKEEEIVEWWRTEVLHGKKLSRGMGSYAGAETSKAKPANHKQTERSKTVQYL